MPSAGVKVYVGNLPERSNPEDIKECFAKYGNVVNMELKGNYGFIVSVSPLCVVIKNIVILYIYIYI